MSRLNKLKTNKFKEYPRFQSLHMRPPKLEHYNQAGSQRLVMYGDAKPHADLPGANSVDMHAFKKPLLASKIYAWLQR